MKLASQTVVLLTGGAGGIGQATARALGEKGYRVGLTDLAADRLSAAASALQTAGVTVAATPADVRDRAGLRAAFDQLQDSLGPADVVVTCAGVGTLSNIGNLDLDGLRAMFEVNVLGMANAIEAVLPGMIARRAGHIVGVASVAAYRGMPWMPGYSASKAAVATYLEALRPALKRRGIRVTTVFPGFVRTAMTQDTPFRHPVRMLEPDQAAAYLVRAIQRRPRDYAFHFGIALGMDLLRRMPSPLFDWVMDRAGPKALKSEF
jgi:short-subunit dehydrogenase